METIHKIALEKTTIFTRENYLLAQKIQEAIEIRKRPVNFNGDTGITQDPCGFPASGTRFATQWLKVTFA